MTIIIFPTFLSRQCNDLSLLDRPLFVRSMSCGRWLRRGVTRTWSGCMTDGLGQYFQGQTGIFVRLPKSPLFPVWRLLRVSLASARLSR